MAKGVLSTSDKARYVTLGVKTGAPDRPYAWLPQEAAGVMRCTAFVWGRRGTPACAWERGGARRGEGGHAGDSRVRVGESSQKYTRSGSLGLMSIRTVGLGVSVRMQGDRIFIPCNDVDRRLERDLISGS